MGAVVLDNLQLFDVDYESDGESRPVPHDEQDGPSSAAQLLPARY